tara:strand:+ start:1126 stop:1749 length:624 start_codon:yes stop_codon:yes gene_type:complete
MRLRILPLLMATLFANHTVHALEPVNDDELATVTGAEGVQLSLRLRNNLDGNGAPRHCTGSLNGCRMGLEFAGREGIWLMLKDYYGALEINDIRLEGDVLPGTATSYADPDRFLSLTGDCLVNDCDPSGLQAVRVSYPASKGPGEYNDLNLLVNIGRTALEFDDGTTPGYMRDVAGGSVLGFRMADSQTLNAPSRSKFMGNAYVFGF